MAYADWVEGMSKAERKAHGDVPVSLQGVDWDEDAPGTPDAAEQAARELAELYEAENGVSLDVLWDRALTADGITDPDERVGADESVFGRYLAHMAVGSGISWFDDHAQFDLKGVFAFECSFDGEYLDWSGRIEKTYNPAKRHPSSPAGPRKVTRKYLYAVAVRGRARLCPLPARARPGQCEPVGDAIVALLKLDGIDARTAFVMHDERIPHEIVEIDDGPYAWYVDATHDQFRGTMGKPIVIRRHRRSGF
jgi:hypothetical protein